MIYMSDYHTPVYLLTDILKYQSWGDNIAGEKSENFLIREIGDLTDTTHFAPIRLQVSDVDSSYTDALIKKICTQCSIVQFTDVDGYDAIRYLFDTSTVTYNFIFENVIDAGEFYYLDSSQICINPIIKYDFCHARSNYTRELKITNVHMPEFQASYVSGFENANDGEYYWTQCKTKLYPLCKSNEDIDSQLSDNDLICTYAGALQRLDNIITLMSAKRYKFSVPFEIAYTLKPGDIISLNFPNVSYTGKRYLCSITGLTKEKDSNDVQISVIILKEDVATPVYQTGSTGTSFQTDQSFTVRYQTN